MQTILSHLTDTPPASRPSAESNTSSTITQVQQIASERWMNKLKRLLVAGVLLSCAVQHASAQVGDVIDRFGPAVLNQPLCGNGSVLTILTDTDLDANGAWDTLVVFERVTGEAFVQNLGAGKVFFFSPHHGLCGGADEARGRIRIRFVDALAPNFNAFNPATWVFKGLRKVHVDVGLQPQSSVTNPSFTVQAFRQLGQLDPLLPAPPAIVDFLSPNTHFDFVDAAGIKEIFATSDFIESFIRNLIVDQAPVITINSVTALEAPPSQLVPMVFIVALSAPSAIPISVNFATRSGTATQGSDFVAASGTLTFPPGAQYLPIVVQNFGDGVPEASGETFFVDLANPVGATFGLRTGTGLIIDNRSFLTGVFSLSSDLADKERAEVDEIVNFSLVWTVPSGEVWRNLNTIDLRLRDGGDIALWVRWDEAANTFSLCENDHKHRRHGHGCRDEDDDADSQDADVIVGPGALPGSATVLETPYARLHLNGTSVVGSGPTGQAVTLNLAVSFKKKAAGHGYKLKLAATDDLGHEDDFITVTKVFVESIMRR